MAAINVSFDQVSRLQNEARELGEVVYSQLRKQQESDAQILTLHAQVFYKNTVLRLRNVIRFQF